MNNYIKSIIIGFALMIIGGFLFVGTSIAKGSTPAFMVLLSYGLFVGFLIVVLVVLSYPNDKE